MPAPLFVEVDTSGAFADGVVLTLATFTGATWRKSVLPSIASLFVDNDAAIAFDLYLAPNGIADESRRIPIVRGTAIWHEAVFCFPWWVNPATGAPWELRLTKAAGAALSSFVRLQLNFDGGGL